MFGQLIPHKVHSRRFIVFTSIKVLISNWPDLLAFANLRPDLVLNAQKLRQPLLTLCDIGVLDEHGALPVVAIRDQRVISIKLFLNACGLKNFFDAQHLLNLILNCQLVFKDKQNVIANPNPPILLVS